MREKKGPIARTVGAVAGSISSAARRSQIAATARVVIYDSGGQATVLRPDTPAHTALAEPAERLILAAREGRPRRRGSDDEGGSEPA